MHSENFATICTICINIVQCNNPGATSQQIYFTKIYYPCNLGFKYCDLKFWNIFN